MESLPKNATKGADSKLPNSSGLKKARHSFEKRNKTNKIGKGTNRKPTQTQEPPNIIPM
jgi:hypothetical protein